MLLKKLSDIIKITANSQPQIDFLAATEYEVLYGGSAGSGKSRGLVMDNVRYIDNPKYTSIIFRRTYPELLGSIYPHAREIFDQCGGVYNESKKTFTFPSGANVRLGYMDGIEDWRNYQGHEYAGMYFDELTNFQEYQYTSILPWNRTKAMGIEPFVRSASNPGSIGHIWVRKRFVDTCKAVKAGKKRYSKIAKTWWQPMVSGPTYWHWLKNIDGSKVWTSRKFIPARVFDNTDLLKRNPRYLVNLLQLPERQRRALLEGDWDAFEGQFFAFNPEQQVITPFEINPNWMLCFSLDPGYGGYCSFSIGAVDFEYNYYRVATYYHNQRSPSKNVEGIKSFINSQKLIKRKEPDRFISDPFAWQKRDKFAMIESDKTLADLMQEEGYYLEKATTDRLVGWATLQDYIDRKDKRGDPKYYVFDYYNEPFLEQLISAVGDEKVPGDLEGKGRDPHIPYHCFVAGTKVLTIDGYRSIENIKKGDLVYTSKGFKKVLLTHKLKDKKEVVTYLVNNVRITCTPDHLFKTGNKGYIEIHSLTNKDTLCKLVRKGIILWENTESQKLFSLKALNSTVILNLPALVIEIIIDVVLQLASNIYILLFGNLKTVEYQKGFMYTTKTITNKIMIFQILSLSRNQNIYHIMQKSGKKKIKSGLKTTWLKLEKALKNGIALKKVENGIVSMLKKIMRKGKIYDSKKGVLNVIKSFFLKQRLENIAIRIAKQGTTEEYVFDLTVADAHEYCVEGFMVHNCLDEERYRIMAIYRPDKEKEDDEPEWYKEFMKEEGLIGKDNTTIMSQ